MFWVLRELCGGVGGWACSCEEEGLDDAAERVWIEGLNSCRKLNVKYQVLCISEPIVFYPVTFLVSGIRRPRLVPNLRVTTHRGHSDIPPPLNFSLLSVHTQPRFSSDRPTIINNGPWNPVILTGGACAPYARVGRSIGYS